MLDHALESGFVAFLEADALFVGIHFFTGHDDGERHAPSITVESKSEALVGSAVVFRSDLTIAVESEGHDNRPDAHAALVEKVRARLANKAGAATAVNAGMQVCLYGYAFTGSNLDVGGTRFRTSLTFKVGYGVA